MLKSIFIITIMSFNLGLSESAYQDYLGYRTVERGTLNAATANSWGARRWKRTPYIVMQPESGAEVYLRILKSKGARRYRPMRQEGWNAVEILVQDPDRLAGQLKGSPFEIVGPPAFLTAKKNVRAMQVLGPSKELLYLTRIVDPARSSFKVSTAATWVDHPFIMVLGGRDMEAMHSFYTGPMQMPFQGPLPYRISVLSRAYKLPPDTMHELGIVQLDRPFLLELDRYPAAARSAPKRGLPRGGVAMVSFLVERIPGSGLPLLSAPAAAKSFPYRGRRRATLRGGAGELIELVERVPQARGETRATLQP